MIVRFRTNMRVSDTMMFEEIYEESLRLDEDEKSEIVNNGLAVWMFVDDVLAGETYGMSLSALDEEIEDCKDADPRSIYCFSTTVLPAFQGNGLGKILVAYWDGMAQGAGYGKILGHATSPAMVAIRAFFGATFSAVHEHWGGTERTAHFYELALSDKGNGSASPTSRKS